MKLQNYKKLFVLGVVLCAHVYMHAANVWSSGNLKPNIENDSVRDAIGQIWTTITEYQGTLAANRGEPGYAASTINWQDWAKGGLVYRAIEGALIETKPITMTLGSGLTTSMSFKALGGSILKRIDTLAKAMLAVKAGTGSLTQHKSTIDTALNSIEIALGEQFLNPCAGSKNLPTPNAPTCDEQWSLLKVIWYACARVFQQDIKAMLKVMISESAGGKVSDLTTFMNTYVNSLFTPKAQGTILTENLITDQELTNFKVFFGNQGKFRTFIGMDNILRAVDAQWLTEEYVKLAVAIQKVFLSLGAASLKTGDAAARLEKAKKMRMVNLKDIKWSSDPKYITNIDFILKPLTTLNPTLDSLANSAQKIIDGCEAGKLKCWFKPCRDRFDLLSHAATALLTTLGKVSGAIDDLKTGAGA